MAAAKKTYIRNCTGGNCETEQKKSRIISRIIFRILVAAFLASLVFVLFFSYFLQITNINVSGNQELNGKELIDEIQKNLDGKFLNVVPKNNYLFVSSARYSDLLKNKYKKIRNVSVEKKFPDTIMLKLEERKALMVWCAAESCFLIDEKGVAYNQADFSSPEIVQNNLLKINDQSAAPVLLGAQIIDQELVSYLLAIKDAIVSFGFKNISDYSTPSRMSEEIDVTMENGMKIYFSTQYSLEDAIKVLGLVLKKEISDKDREYLEYIDLRTENKVFYKLKNTEDGNDQQEKE